MKNSKFIVMCAQKAGSSKAEAGRWVKIVFDTLREAIIEEANNTDKNQKTVLSIRGLGRYVIKKRGLRKYKSPFDRSKLVVIPPRYLPKFMASNSLKEKLLISGEDTK